jgi:GTPase SAR1 family protein
MGCTSSKSALATRDETYRSRAIDSALDDERQSELDVVKLLLLGPGESGKSTIFKQMKLMYGVPYNDEERTKYRVYIRQNIMETMERLCIAAYQGDENDPVMLLPEFDLLCEDPTRDALNKNFNAFHNFPPLTEEKAQAVKTLWEHPSIQKAWSIRSSLQIIDSAAFFFDRVLEVARNDFIPSEEEILHTRIRTSGVRENQFKIQGKRVQIFDLGGQKSERRKWLNVFQGVHSIIFMCAISEFDQFMWEDTKTNRLSDGLALFAKLASDPAFIDTTFILFFNKIDLFTEKLKSKNIKDFPEWSDYAGKPHDVDDGVAYFKRKFLNAAKNSNDGSSSTSKRDVNVFVTCATDLQVMNNVMKSVEPVLITQALDDFGF